MIREIYFKPGSYKFINEPGGNQSEIVGLNKVNIFVGANNSGKSRFIRSLLMENYNKKVQGQSNLGNTHDCNQILTNVRLKLTEIINIYKEGKGADLSNTTDITKILDELNTASTSGEHKRNIDNLALLKQQIDNIDSNDAIREEMNNAFKNEVFKLGEIPYATIIFKDFKAVYISMMRGLRPLIKTDSSNIGDRATPYSDFDCFEDRTIWDHFTDSQLQETHINNMKIAGQDQSPLDYFNGSYDFDIFTGLDLYKEVKEMLLGTHEKRRFIREYEEFLKDIFFDKQSITLIPRIDNDVLYIKIGNEEERPIYNMGDGLQTIIIATFPLFKYKSKKLLLFIEEPELTLHPGMQRKLLNAYCTEFENAQIFITTHSNHLLDLTLDFDNKCSIYSFERESDKKFEINNVTPNKDVLDLLGVRSSSVFLSNCVIWVEGISDRLYVRKFLELYNKKLEENNKKLKSQAIDMKEYKKIYEKDKHYSIVEYGGENITHFNFFDPDTEETTINIESVAHNNFIIADNDGYEHKGVIKEKDKPKTKRLKLLSIKLGNSFFAEHKEIENLIPFRVYMKYFERLPPSASRKWEYDSTRAKEKEFVNDLKSRKIGDVVKKHFVKLIDKYDQPDRFKRKDLSCIGEKKEIAERLIDTINAENITFGELPKTTQKLTKILYGFIEGNNSH
jgi:predicted ATP-dependent endonuclease of OLD family